MPVFIIMFLGHPSMAQTFDPGVRYPFDDCVEYGTSPGEPGPDLSLHNTGCGNPSISLGSHLGHSWDSGTALYGDGNDDYGAASADSVFQPTQLTLSLWVYSSDWAGCSGGACSLVSKANTEEGTSNGYWLLVESASSLLRFTVGDNSGTSSVYGVPLSTGQWHHVAATFSSTQVATVYLNGSVVGTGTLPRSIGYGTEDFLVGAMTNRRFDHFGYIDEVSLWDRALSDGDIAWVYDFYTDGDGDGFNHTDDCDPDSGSVFPGAPEVCDQLDNDCDSSVDEDVDLFIWYVDADGDGYGNPEFSIEDCRQPSGYVADSADCNDDDRTTFPGADEIPYDGVDQDCDGSDLCDVDDDGYEAQECQGTDCDDLDASSYPGAAGLTDDCQQADGGPDSGIGNADSGVGENDKDDRCGCGVDAGGQTVGWISMCILILLLRRRTGAFLPGESTQERSTRAPCNLGSGSASRRRPWSTGI
ncbi:MAG: hypothetical protein H6739_37960 [Alphaproteobacteria bacterium]|nr:hypothetical protein [Alphaproteobacteria bacterium]